MERISDDSEGYYKSIEMILNHSVLWITCINEQKYQRWWICFIFSYICESN